jgi:riboflavin synthase
LWVDAVGETLKKSTLETAGSGKFVNLERALRLSDRLGGHLVQGHVNGMAQITRVTRLGENYQLELSIPETLERYVIDEGSIAVDGISLTIARVNGIRLTFSIIPHTWNHTTLQTLSVGDRVNIETDVLANYIEKLLADRQGGTNRQILSEEWLKKLGY